MEKGQSDRAGQKSKINVCLISRWSQQQTAACSTYRRTACVFNFQAHDVPVLVSEGLLKPLGDPPPNGVKYFSTKEVLERAQDEKWLHRATHTSYKYWQKRNARKKESGKGEGNILSPPDV